MSIREKALASFLESGLNARLEETCRCRKLSSWQNQVMCNNPSITSCGGQASNCNLHLVILSLWGIRSVIPLANICLGMVPNLICWQWVGLRAPIHCYLDSRLPGRSGLFTPPEAWLSRPAYLQPEVAEARDMHERRGRGGRGGEEWRLFKNAAQVFNWCREGPLWDDRVSGQSGGKANPNVGMGWLPRCWGRMQVMDGSC